MGHDSFCIVVWHLPWKFSAVCICGDMWSAVGVSVRKVPYDCGANASSYGHESHGLRADGVSFFCLDVGKKRASSRDYHPVYGGIFLGIHPSPRIGYYENVKKILQRVGVMLYNFEWHR